MFVSPKMHMLNLDLPCDGLRRENLARWGCKSGTLTNGISALMGVRWVCFLSAVAWRHIKNSAVCWTMWAPDRGLPASVTVRNASLLFKLPTPSCVSPSIMSDSCDPRGLQPAQLLHPWNSPGKNSGVDGYSLLQGIQGRNPGSCPVCRFFTQFMLFCYGCLSWLRQFLTLGRIFLLKF